MTRYMTLKIATFFTAHCDIANSSKAKIIKAKKKQGNIKKVFWKKYFGKVFWNISENTFSESILKIQNKIVFCIFKIKLVFSK
jgi:hypothetical protein